ncbi:MAG: hypothetical protein LUE64_04175 [Candidatus Gastranaerophilales bacterium]|nr:hypothetical protein [Candidatus Gastranaerophilales bacterium]
MSQIMKNRCVVIFEVKGTSIGTYRPTQKKFHSLQKKLEPFRILYPKAKTFRSNYRIVLKQEKVKMGTYKVPKEMFEKIKSEIEQYRSLGSPSKKIRCIETGVVFQSAREAACWTEFAREMYYCNQDLIKQCCRGKQKTSYGYHWEFVNEELDRLKAKLNEKFCL